MRYSDKIQEIESIIRKGPYFFSINSFPYDRLAQEILTVFFINSVSEYSWFEVVTSVFNKYRGQFPKLRHSYLIYLEKACKQPGNNRCIADAALELEGLDIPDWLIWLRLINKLDWQSAVPLIERFIIEVPSSRIDGLTSEMQELAIRALEQETISLGLRLLDKLLRFVPLRADQVKSPKDYLGLINKPEPPISVVTFSEVIKKLSKDTPRSALFPVFETLCELLNNAIDLSVPTDESEGRCGDDGSDYWRPAIEQSDQNHGYDSREHLVTGIRNFAERIISDDPSRFDEVCATIGTYTWLIFERLNLHLIRCFGSSQQVSRALIAGAALGTNNPHEWFVMLQEKFASLDNEDKNKILRWIEVGPDLSARIDHYRQGHDGAPPDEETIDIWKRYWQYQQLSLLNEGLPDHWQIRFKELDDHFKTPGHPAFKSWNSGVQTVPTISPFTEESILSDPNDGVVSEIREWKQKQHLDDVNEWGLLGALKSAALKHPEFFFNEIHKYRNLSNNERLSADRYLSILQGCFEAGIAGTMLDWSALLTETEWAIREAILKLANSENRNLGIDIARGLEGAISKKEAKFPTASWDQLLRCITLLLRHPDPDKDRKDTESPGELAMTSLNTVRLVAMRALFDLDWVLHSEGVPQRDDLKKRVLELLEERLKTEPTLAGRGIYGEKINMLLHLHREWVEKHLSDLFPEGVEHETERNAVWSCFVTMQGATKTAFEVLWKEYGRAIESISQEPRKKDSGQWFPDEGLVHHLAAYYWWGNLPLPNQPGASGNLLDQFYKKGTVALRAHLLTFIGRSMRTTKEGVPEDIKKRFQDLMEWRLRELEQSSATIDQRAELEGFWTWVDAQRLDAEWTMKTLQRVLSLHPFVEDGHDFMVIKPLADYSANYPEMAMECFYRIVFAEKDGEKETPYWWGLDEEIKTILRNGLASMGEAKKQSEEVQDHLLRLGRFQFRNLDPKRGDAGGLG